MVLIRKSSLLVNVQTIPFHAQTVYLAPAMRIKDVLRYSLEQESGEKLRSGGFLADAIPWWHTTKDALVGPVLGGPAVSLGLRPFLEMGTTRVVFLGYCGSLISNIGVGEVVLPLSMGESDDGTRSRIEHTRPSALIDFSLCLQTAHLAHIISVTDPHLTQAADVTSWQSQGIQAIEMETATLASLQTTYTFELYIALIVSDLFQNNPESIRRDSGLRSKVLRERTQSVAHSIVERFS